MWKTARTKLDAGYFFFSTWKSRKEKNLLLSEIRLVEVLKQERGKETHGHLLLYQIPPIHAEVICNTLHVQKKLLLQTCSTVLLSGQTEGTNSISEGATAWHNLYRPVSCELTSLISSYTTHPNLFNRPQLHRLTYTDTLCVLQMLWWEEQRNITTGEIT